MSEAQIQAIKDVIKMTPRLNIECLNSIKVLMEKAIDSELLRLEPTVILKNPLAKIKKYDIIETIKKKKTRTRTR